MLTKISSATTWGIQTHAIDVEIDLSYGMIQFHIVGLPDAAIRESKQRILTAIKQCGFRLPDRKITVNLAPADIKKEGTLFDLPIAIGILHEAEFIKIDPTLLQNSIFLGELSLDGAIKPVKGIIPIACDMVRLQKKQLIVAPANAREASIIDYIDSYGFEHLTQLIAWLRGELHTQATKNVTFPSTQLDSALDMADVKGQRVAKRALQISAAGRHNILMMGSPGSGKTMLAQRLSYLLPPLTYEEMIETSKIYSVSGKLMNSSLSTERPFRAPHHTISGAGLIGGGSIPQPGEISLAHHGTLFLDELTEFKATTLEALRQPLEHHEVHIARAQHAISYPASFLFVAALNPCPCGFLDDPRRTCRCSPQRVQNYLAKLSGPLLDRIDLQVSVQSLSFEALEQDAQQHISSETLRQGVTRAVEAQRKRHYNSTHTWNGYLNAQQIDAQCIVTERARITVKQAFEKLQLTMRSYHKLLKVARTIADIEGCELIDTPHIQEAMSYRLLERLRDKK